MDKDSIITLPHPSLRQKSKKVGLVTPEISRIIEGMKSATSDWEAHREHEVGVALAAVQVNKLYKIIIIRNDFDNKDDHSFSVFINPKITKYYGDIEEDYEGCLSVLNIYGKVPRYTKVKVRAQNEQGQIIQAKAEGFLARIFQHEIDHVNGITYIDHIKDRPDAFYELTEKGNLEKLDYNSHIINNSDLW